MLRRANAHDDDVNGVLPVPIVALTATLDPATAAGSVQFAAVAGSWAIR